jgi:predicted lipoprotein with Yx(FWY)xxD motif
MTTMSKITENSRHRASSQRWLPVAGLVVAAATTLAACGGGSSSNSSSGGGGNAQSGGGNKAVVSMQKTDGVGTRLVDSSGKTLYFSDQEKSGTISCTGACLGFWFPDTVAGKTVSQPKGLSGKLGTIKRSDNGKMQLTYNGAPLYTFKLDTSSGDAKGNNFKDNFGSSHFTWHAAGATSSSKSKGGGGGDNGGYGNY